MGYLILHTKAISLLKIALVFFFLPLASSAQLLYETNSGKVSFVSDAPLESIAASSNKLKGLVNFSEAKFAFSIDIKSFEGFNGDLQKEHFNENYLESSSYPTATFSGKIIDPIQPNLNSQTLRAKGILDIHGVKKERIISVDVVKKNDGYFIKTSFQVPLTDHGINVPRIVYQKISEVIAITLEAQLQEKK